MKNVQTLQEVRAARTVGLKRNVAQGAKSGPRVRISYVNKRGKRKLVGVFPTIIDESNTVRFPVNRIVEDMADMLQGSSEPPWNGALTLNDIAAESGMGNYTRTERRHLMRWIGYSLTGYGELFPNDKLEVEFRRGGGWEPWA